MSNQTVLIVAYRGPLMNGIAAEMRQAGCEVLLARDGMQAVQRAVALLPDVVLLDNRLPDTDPVEVCRQIQRRLPAERMPTMVLTSMRDATADVLLDVLARQKAIRDGEQPEDVAEDETVCCLGLTMDRRRYQAEVDGRQVELTSTQFRLLWTLVSNPGRVFNREQLCESGRGRHSLAKARTIDAHVMAIRKKLGAYGELIETVRGVGYRFKDVPAARLETPTVRA